MEDSTTSLAATSPTAAHEDAHIPPLLHDTQAQDRWLGFDQIPLTLVDERHYTQVISESLVASLLVFTLLSVFIIFVATVPTLVALPIISALAMVLSTICYFRYAHAKSIGYGVCSDELLMQKGVIWFKRISLPYTRLQHISLTQGPIERKFGLHTLKCFSAGSGSAEIELPGLESRTAEKLRQHLLAKAGIASQTARSHATSEPVYESGHEPAPITKPEAIFDNEKLIEVAAEVIPEMKAEIEAVEAVIKDGEETTSEPSPAPASQFADRER